MLKKGVIISISVLLLTSCYSIKIPSTPDEFRSYGKNKSYFVNEPINSVVSRFKSNAQRCLNTVVKVYSKRQNQIGKGITMYRYYNTEFETKSSELSQLHIRVQRTADENYDLKKGSTGMYRFSVDLAAVESNRTRIDIYGKGIKFLGIKSADVNIEAAIDAWGKEKSNACPNLFTKVL